MATRRPLVIVGGNVQELASPDIVDPSCVPLASLGGEAVANKDATGGYVGLTQLKINFLNALGTFKSFFTNANTAVRTYMFPDKDGTVAMLSDITGTNSGTNTGDQTLGSLGAEAAANKDANNGYVGLTLFKINFKNVANTITSFLTNVNTTARTYTFPDKDITVAGTVDVSTLVQNSQSAAYTLVLTDAGKQIFHPVADTTARTFTIPANATVAFPVGTAITFVNQFGAGVITIAITTDVMRLVPTGTTGNRTLAAGGSATALKITATEWQISGGGLT